MSLAEEADRPNVTETLTGKAEVGADGGEFIDVQTTEPVGNWADVFTRFNLDPNLYDIVDDTVRMSTWQQSKRLDNGERDIVDLYSYRARFTRKLSTIDLPALYAEVARTRHRPLKPKLGNSTTVVVWADMQLGKVGSRGGTPELLERMAEKRSALDTYLRRSKSTRTVFVDAGDAVEGFENVASQMFTNDLSPVQQVDLAAVEMWKTLVLLAKHAPVDALAVPSNHGAWRSGKQVLGKPSDDWGLGIQSRLQFQAELVGLPITFHHPEAWDESLALDVRGTILGVHHGHQSAVDLMPKWWAGQVHGGQAIASADVLVTGHYHHLRVQPTGRNPRNGRSKWWLQAPTLDNGSDWFRNKSGDDSDPGLLVFDIAEDRGFDLQSLTVL
jgi:hypothetical protein